MKEITRKLKSSWNAGTSDDAELVDITTQLYPVEVLYAAQNALGIDKITAYYAEMYEFGINNQAENLQIKKTQYSGIKLTHQKIKKWLNEQGIGEIANLENPEVTKVYLKHHLQQMRESVKVFEAIAKALGDD